MGDFVHQVAAEAGVVGEKQPSAVRWRKSENEYVGLPSVEVEVLALNRSQSTSIHPKLPSASCAWAADL